jgi:hypothetical protein
MLRSTRADAEIRACEGGLLDVARMLPATDDELGAGARFALWQAHRAASIFRGILALEDGPSVSSLFVLARPLVEIGIRLAWVTADPATRIKRWGAEQERRDVQLIRDMRSLSRRSGVNWDDAETRAIEDEKLQRIAEVRSEVGLDEKTPMLPSLLKMAEEVGSREATEAYNIGYRSLSPWTHSDDAAFRLNFPGDAYVPDPSPSIAVHEAQFVRLVVISLVAWIFEVAGEAMGRPEIAKRARSILDLNLEAGRADVPS